ncbi:MULTISPECIES: GNAT family N-acetyltransferase [unclassified Xanthobacter]|uniref:GNAT family N-acetyltransferase n=1 Tax=unclassified Xanthobacter TaxID=2623496 RepID=UPI001F16A712
MPVRLHPDGLIFRLAHEQDLPAVVALFADDEVGGHGDTTDAEAFADYRAAYQAICANPSTWLYVAEIDGRVVGTFELIFAHSLPGRGVLRAILEGVQVVSDLRGRRIGERMVRHAMAEARAAGAVTLALTSNRRREASHRFYERLGFASSHFGFKIELT